MTRIYLYGAEATYGGGCDFEWQAPPLGGRHKLILFLAQTDESAQEGRAASELTKFGFIDLHVGPGRPIDVEALNDSNSPMKAVLAPISTAQQHLT